MFPKLNLPDYTFKLKVDKSTTQRTQIFDRIRKKYIALTPEEWVRQHFINYLIEDLKYPESLISVEAGLKYNQLRKRCDIVIYNNTGTIEMIVECKSFDVVISQDTFDQAAQYNFKLHSKYLVVTNGLKHYCCEMDYQNNTYKFLQETPIKSW